MTYEVEVLPSGLKFTVQKGQTLLQGALSEGIMLLHSCREGTCGTCKGTVVKGEIDHGNSDLDILSEQERTEGAALFCQAKPESDLTIHAPEVSELKGISVQKTAARLIAKEKISQDVVILNLALPPAINFNYYPGQYIEIILKNGATRSYSMANLPSEQNLLQLHIRNTGGLFSSFAYDELEPRTLLRIEGPFGSFYLRDSERPMVFLASGTGFAPIKALLKQLASSNNKRPVHMYWGGRVLKDLYMHDWMQDFAQQHSWVRYTPVLSEQGQNEGWAGATGLVHQQVLQDFSDLSEFEVYACGNPLMVDAAREDFVLKAKLAQGRFFADAFI